MLVARACKAALAQPLRALAASRFSTAVQHKLLEDESSPAPAYRRILFLGPPGSGKGTYSHLLAPMLGITHLSPGESLRAEMRIGTELGKRAAEYMRRGELVPPELILQAMSEVMRSCKRGFLLDGFPRNWEQAQLLDSLTDLDLVIHIKMREDVLKTKLAGRRLCSECGLGFNVADVNLNNGQFLMPPMLPSSDDCVRRRCVDRLEQREDDTPAAIERRLQIYADTTEQLVDHYRERTEVEEIHIAGGKDAMLPVFYRVLKMDPPAH